MPTVQYSHPGKVKKLNNMYRKGIRIYTGTLRMSPVELLHAEACDPTMELRKNELGLRMLYRLRSNSTYTVSLNTLDDRKYQNYVGN